MYHEATTEYEHISSVYISTDVQAQQSENVLKSYVYKSLAKIVVPVCALCYLLGLHHRHFWVLGIQLW